MKTKIFTCVSVIVGSMLMTSCDTAKLPELTSMKCEYVPDNGTAVLYGKNLKSVEVVFPGELVATPLPTSNDTVLYVTVPEGAQAGRIVVRNRAGEVKSPFHFRDSRNVIINFDDRIATWGGYEPFDENGEKIRGVVEMPDSVTPLPSELPDECDGNYGFLYGNYDNSWTMTHTMFIQYVANPEEGGRGEESIANVYKNESVSDLVLKFEVCIPKTSAYVGPRTELFFGPSKAPNKHGRELSAICFWKPYEKVAGEGYHTNGEWETITIPLTEFHHGIDNDTIDSKYPLDLQKATNFSFVQFGKADSTLIFMCVDNFRIVPAK